MTRLFLTIILLATTITIHAPVVAGDFDCKITETDTDAELDAAGPNSRCGQDPKGPWACLCQVTEECRNSDNGLTQIFHRRQFLGCGELRDCQFNTTYGRSCKAMEN